MQICEYGPLCSVEEDVAEWKRIDVALQDLNRISNNTSTIAAGVKGALKSKLNIKLLDIRERMCGRCAYRQEFG